MHDVTARRCFLERAALVAVGTATGLTLPHLWRRPAAQADDHPEFSAEARITKLGLELPPATKPVATYVPTVLVGDLLYVAGHGPRDANGKPIQGKVGSDLDLEEGQAAARRVGLIVLARVRRALGSLDRVQRLVKTLGMVNCTSDFTQQPLVINGFSNLMVEVFGEERGKGTRSAVGVNALPNNIAVEIESIFQVRT